MATEPSAPQSPATALLQVGAAAALRAQVAAWRGSGARVALVPTMGNLHAGHLALVALARRHADHVVASIFVNPTQFGPNEDYASYPRTPEADAAALAGAGCDLLFQPELAQIYPAGAAALVALDPGPLGDDLCGAFRPGHFRGVLQVVARLFNLVAPDVAVFGEKDYQQLVLLRALARDLAFPIEVLSAPTVREADGLAMSSRNQYLSAPQRQQAALLYQALQAGAAALQAGASIAEVEQAGHDRLLAGGFRPDYYSVRRAHDLAPAQAGEGMLRLLAAARLGRTRLIDNLAVELRPVPPVR